MQLKTLFYVASALTIVLAGAAVSDVLTDISKIDARVNLLQESIANFPQSGVSVAQLLDAHTKANSVIDALQDATVTTQEFDDEATVDSGFDVLNAFHTMAPVIHKAVDTVIAKKDAIISVGRASAVVKLDLLGILSAAIELQNVLIPLAPTECGDEANALKFDINTAINTAIETFS